MNPRALKDSTSELVTMLYAHNAAAAAAAARYDASSAAVRATLSHLADTNRVSGTHHPGPTTALNVVTSAATPTPANSPYHSPGAVAAPHPAPHPAILASSLRFSLPSFPPPFRLPSPKSFHVPAESESSSLQRNDSAESGFDSAHSGASVFSPPISPSKQTTQTVKTNVEEITEASRQSLADLSVGGRRTTRKLGGVVERRQNRLRCRRNACAGLSDKEALEIKRLREAVQSGDADRVDSLIDGGCDVSAPDDKGRTPLHFASAKGNVRIVQRLLAQGADVNRVDYIGNTPLHLAACTNQIPVVTLLIKAGSDVSQMDRAGRTPINLARSRLQMLRQTCTNLSRCVQMEKDLTEVMDLMRAYLHCRGGAAGTNGDSGAESNLDDLCALLRPVAIEPGVKTGAVAAGGNDGATAGVIADQMDAILREFDRTCSLLGDERKGVGGGGGGGGGEENS